jgi:hypothetical protein
MNKILHMSLDVRGALNWKKRGFPKGLFKHEDGRSLSYEESREVLLDKLEEGFKFLPIGECPSFDPKKGCPGHEVSE